MFVHPGISSRMVDGALCFSDTERPLRIQQFSIHSYVGQRCFAMGMLDKGVLQWKNRGGNRQKVQTAVSYKSKSGKTCYKGTAALKKTEILGIGWAIIFHPFFLQDRNILKHHFRLYKTMKIKTMYFGLSL